MIAALVLLAGPAAGAELSLEEAWALAARAPAAAQAVAAEEAGRAERFALRAYQNPEVSYQGYKRRSGTADAINGEQHQVDLGLAVPLTGARGARVREGRLAEVAGAASAREIRAAVAEEVADAWLELLAAQERVGVLGDAAASIDDVLARTRQRVAEGGARRYDHDRIALVRASLARQQGLEDQERRLAAARLAALIGLSEEAPAGRGRLADLDGWLVGPEGTAPSVARARAVAERMEAAVRAARRSRLADPQVSAGGYWTVDGTSTSIVGGLSWELPVFERGRAEVAAARAGQRAAEAELGQLEAARAARRAALVASADALAAALRVEAPDGAAVLRAAEVAYNEGEGSVLELVDATTARVDTSIEQVDTWLELRRTELQIAALDGGLDLP